VRTFDSTITLARPRSHHRRGSDYAELFRQVLTSHNGRGNWLVKLVLGGLNDQIEHHLRAVGRDGR